MWLFSSQAFIWFKFELLIFNKRNELAFVSGDIKIFLGITNMLSVSLCVANDFFQPNSFLE